MALGAARGHGADQKQCQRPGKKWGGQHGELGWTDGLITRPGGSSYPDSPVVRLALNAIDRFSKRMSEMTGERGGFSGKERARRLLGQ